MRVDFVFYFYYKALCMHYCEKIRRLCSEINFSNLYAPCEYPGVISDLDGHVCHAVAHRRN